MRYEKAKKLREEDFQRLTDVKRRTYDKMIEILRPHGVVALLNSIFSNSYPVDNQKKHRFFVVFNLQMASKSLKYIGLNCTTKPLQRR